SAPARRETEAEAGPDHGAAGGRLWTAVALRIGSSPRRVTHAVRRPGRPATHRARPTFRGLRGRGPGDACRRVRAHPAHPEDEARETPVIAYVLTRLMPTLRHADWGGDE